MLVIYVPVVTVRLLRERFQFIVYKNEKGQDQRWSCPNYFYRILSAERFQRKETDSY